MSAIRHDALDPREPNRARQDREGEIAGGDEPMLPGEQFGDERGAGGGQGPSREEEDDELGPDRQFGDPPATSGN